MLPLLLPLLVAAAVGPAPPARLSLDEALARARANNARLPVAALDVEIADRKLHAAEARRRPRVSLEGDLLVSPAWSYDPVVTNLGDERAQVAAERPLYDGGARRAQTVGARAELGLRRARYRQAVRDLELEVRRSYAEILEGRREIEVRREGLERLESYLALLEDRRRSGQAVAADLLRTRVRLAADRAGRLDAEGRLDTARMRLNTALGRPPEAPLEVVPLPPPAAGSGTDPAGWRNAPEIDAAHRDVDASAAAVDAARAERRPHLSARLDAGLWGSDPTHPVPRDFAAAHPGAGFGDRLRRDAGASFGLTFDLPLFDGGASRARVAAAELALEQARRALGAEEASARLELASARRSQARALDQVEILRAAVPQARDAFLEAESRYRGGAATYLEVLDAFAAAVDTAVEAARADLAYRTAQALVLRWGGPP